MRRPVFGAYARITGADAGEAELPLEAYGSLDQFFVRRLKPGSRPWPEDDRAAGSPVDGIVGCSGRIQQGTLLQAKGIRYTVRDLIADDGEARFRNGHFVTLYLSPRHYHRIHAPRGGVIRAARHVPGSLLPVNAPAVASIPSLFPRNERLLCTIEGRTGPVCVVAVGAYNVGRISADFDPLWNQRPRGRGGVTNRPGSRPETRRYEPPVRVERGQELMAFHLGSTVILLFGEEDLRLDPRLSAGAEIRVGERIAG